MNKLYFGDNLNILRDNIADETVDLIYLDPHVIDREKAAMGFFVTLAEPTGPMSKIRRGGTTEAVSAGFYNNPDLRNYQKIQILTIEGLLNSTQRPDYPDTSLGALTHKKVEDAPRRAQVEKKNKGQEGMF